MKKFIDIIKEDLETAFGKAGYEKEYAKVTLSNRPDLCEYSVTVRWRQQRRIRKHRL